MTEQQKELYHVKLKTGEDMLAMIDHFEDVSLWEDDGVWVNNPIILIIDPELGLYAKKWFNLSTGDAAYLYKNDYFFVSKATREAKSHYNQYLKRQKKLEERFGVSESEYDSDEDDHDMIEQEDRETLLMALLESRVSTKH